jgi:1,4-alpha-glucan branching enzyme
MKNLLKILILIIAVHQLSFAHIITSTPPHPTENDSITIFYDATEGDGGLKGFTGDVYAYTGVNNWAHIVNSSWLDNPVKVKLTRISTDYYKLVIGYPRIYYNVTNPTEHIARLTFVFRNSDGSKTGRDVGGTDIFYNLFQSGYTLTLNSPNVSNPFVDPQRSPLFVNSTDTINLSVKAVTIGTKNSSISLFINGVQKAQTTTDSLAYQILAFQDLTIGANQIIIAGKDTANITDTLKFSLMINPTITNESLPAGSELGINYNSSTSVTLTLLAPQKSFVYVIGDFNNWKVDQYYFMKKDSARSDSVVWWITLNNLIPAKEYSFQYLVDGNLRIADPFTHKVLDPANDSYIPSTVYPNLLTYPYNKTSDIVSVLQTDQQPYNWQITNFPKPDKSKLIVYELLVRDFVSTHWFKTVMDTLNYLKNFGVNAIEIMPVMEFEGNESWGYNVSFHMSLDKYYGTPNALKALIDSAHSKGMAVILDVVLNHTFGQNPLVRLYFDGYGTDQILTTPGNPYFNTQSPNPVFHWGADFNHAKPATQYYVDRVTSYWINEFHIDGYRFDFAKGFTNIFGDGGAYDASRITILERIGNNIWTVDPTSILILENFVDNNEEKVESSFGFLSWGNMNYNYNEATMGYHQSGKSDLSNAYYLNRGWPKPSLVTYMESHDEERLMYKNEQYGNSSPYYQVKSIPNGLSRMGLASAFFFTIPGPKMIWQFGELGYDYSIDYNGRVGNKPIRWDYFNDPDRQKLYRIMSALIKLRNSYPVFQTTASMNVSDSLKSIKFSDSSMKVNIIGNFSVWQTNMNPNFQQTGTWYDYFTGDSIIVTDVNSTISLQPSQYHIYTTVRLPKPDLDIISDVEDQKSNNVVDNFKLEQNYPNPFNPSTVIRYSILSPSFVTLKIYDILGREVKTLVNQEQTSGMYVVNWNGSDIYGNKVSTGVYFYRIDAGNFSDVKKMLLIK